MAEDLLFPFGGAAAVEVDAVAEVLVTDFAVGITDTLVDDDFGAPFPLA